MQIHQRVKIEIFLPKWRKMVWLEKEMLCRVKDIAVYWLYLICCSHLWDVQKHDKGPLCLYIQAGRISVFFLLLWGFIHFLPKGILRTIKSICVAMQKSFPSFNNSYHYEVLEQVEQKLSDPSLYNQVQREVDAYYKNELYCFVVLLGKNLPKIGWVQTTYLWIATQIL